MNFYVARKENEKQNKTQQKKRKEKLIRNKTKLHHYKLAT